jgi:DNA-binding transcriptional MerR regulator
MEGTEKPISPKQVYVKLGIGDSTLRKWCLALEQNHIYFSRTDNNRRIFFEKDLELLRQFRNLVQVQNFSIENAAIVVASKKKEEASAEENSKNGVPAIRDSSEVIQKLLEHIERQEHFNQELLKRLDEQQAYIDERMEKRDQLLLEQVKEASEAKEPEKKPRRGIFRIFSGT